MMESQSHHFLRKGGHNKYVCIKYYGRMKIVADPDQTDPSLLRAV